MKMRILPSAISDLEAGKNFYDLQDPGAGDYFLDRMFSEIDALVSYAGIHHKIHGYHRYLSRRFPYAVYYKMKDNGALEIWRVLDCRRDPETIRKSLED